jgi:predicted ATPase/DNA-binding CsgD family transcriptional regulator
MVTDMAATLVNRHVGNLPAEVTSFVGRRHELAEVRERLQHSRLVTLTGVGGVGKTRLALRVAADVHRAFSDGTWLVELAALSEPDLITHSVLAALGFRDHASGTSLDVLSEVLADRQLLLVLDNCEHVLDACAVLADVLLKTCPQIRILTTSRQPLRIAGEHCVEVEPLGAPDPHGVLTQTTVVGNDAVTLFVERATAVHPGFHIDDQNASLLASICRRLDGIPLALELAAGKLRTMSVEQLLHRLDSRYDLLVGGSRAALPRQQTMRALIDWSFALCTPTEQLMWARLSVFSDGFNLDAAEEVCVDASIPASAVCDTVEGLVDKSIVSIRRGQARLPYRLPETLREYGAERLEEMGDRVAVNRRARDRCAGLVEGLASDWFSSRQADLLRTLRLEHGNIQAALNFCLSEADGSAVGLEIAAGLRQYWMAGERSGEGRHWLERLLAQNPQRTPQRLRALCACAYLTNGPIGTAEAIEAMLDEAQILADELDDRSGAAHVAQQRGLATLFRGDTVRAIALLGAAVDEHRRLRDAGSVALDLAFLALAKSLAGEQDVMAVLDECVTLCTATGESWIRALALWTLGIELCKAGDLSGAVVAQRESLALRTPLEVNYLMALNLDALAWVAVEERHLERAARLFAAAEAIMRDVGGVLVAHGPTASLHEAYQARAREGLGTKEFDSAYASGLQMGFAAALDFALGTRNASSGGEEVGAAATGLAAGLSGRELEVAQLVARGMTNKQIASTLIIAPRTAEGHVEHVLSKLGFTSRAQIATWATEREADQRHTP